MEQSNQSKKVLLSVIGVAILVVAVVGVSFAFFNYTRTGEQNTVNTGKIFFNSSQTENPVVVSNLFPLTAAPQATDEATDFARTVVHVEGATTYSAGLTYQVSAVQKNLTVGANATALPIKVHTYESSVVAAHQGDETGDGLTLNFSTPANLPSATAQAKTILASGTIAANDPTDTWNATRYQRDIVIDAYILAADIAITDTPVESSTWVDGRTQYTTSDWNALSESGGATFKILVESEEAGTSNYVQSGAYQGS